MRRVEDAARRAAYCDRLGRCDDWVMHWLKTCIHDAKVAGHSQQDIDDAAMRGAEKGHQDNE